MKNLSILLLVLTSVFFGCKDPDQPLCEHNITLQPDADRGKDAIIWTEESSVNRGDFTSLSIMAWTFYKNGYDDGLVRSLIEFDLSSIPDGATIKAAKLSLYNDPNSASNSGEHSKRDGSNEVLILPITEAWGENTVTWDNQPSTTATGSIELKASSSAHQDYENIDITDLVAKWYKSPSDNHGIMMQLKTEIYYRCMVYASSDNADSELHPKLEITYLK